MFPLFSSSENTVGIYRNEGIKDLVLGDVLTIICRTHTLSRIGNPAWATAVSMATIINIGVLDHTPAVTPAMSCNITHLLYRPSHNKPQTHPLVLTEPESPSSSCASYYFRRRGQDRRTLTAPPRLVRGSARYATRTKAFSANIVGIVRQSARYSEKGPCLFLAPAV